MDGRDRSSQQLRASVIVDRTRRYGIRQVRYMAAHKHISSTEQYRSQDIDSLQEALNKYHSRGEEMKL